MSALSDYRNFIRPAAGFDGATAETAVYTQTRQVFATTTATAVGRFSPASLNRFNIVSVVRVMLQGVIAPGDEVRVRDTAGQIRYSAPASLASSGWLFLGPEDTLEILALGATSADILVNDLTDEQLQEWIGSEIAQGAVVPPVGQTSVTITATATVPDFIGHLIVFLDCPLAATITLPALAAIPLDSKATFVRIANVGLPTVVTDTPATDEVNGRVGATTTPYNLRSVGDSISYVRVPDGWARAFGDQVTPEIVSAVSPLAIPPFQGGTQYVESQSVAAGHQITLSPLADYREGCRIVINAVAASAHNIVVPTAPDLINGAPNLYLPPAGTMIVEQAGGMWLAVVSDPLNDQQVNAPGPVGPVQGKVVIFIALLVDGDITLPPLAATPEGSEIIFIRRDVAGNGVPRIITDNALDEVNGAAGIVATEYYLRSNHDSITYVRVPSGWAVKMGEQAPDVFTSALSPITVPAWAGGTLYLVDAAVATNQTVLPLLADCRQGCRLVIRCSPTSLSTHRLIPSGADTINGAALFFDYSAGSADGIVVVEHGGTTWLARSNNSELAIPYTLNAAGFLPAVGGQLVVELALAADGDVGLPSPAALPPESTITLYQVGPGTPRIITSGAPYPLERFTIA